MSPGANPADLPIALSLPGIKTARGADRQRSAPRAVL